MLMCHCFYRLSGGKTRIGLVRQRSFWGPQNANIHEVACGLAHVDVSQAAWVGLGRNYASMQSEVGSCICTHGAYQCGRAHARARPKSLIHICVLCGVDQSTQRQSQCYWGRHLPAHCLLPPLIIASLPTDAPDPYLCFV